MRILGSHDHSCEINPNRSGSSAGCVACVVIATELADYEKYMEDRKSGKLKTITISTAELESLREKAAKWDALDEPKECIRPDRHEGPCNGFPRFICCKNPDCPIDCPDSHCIGGFNPYEDADKKE